MEVGRPHVASSSYTWLWAVTGPVGTDSARSICSTGQAPMPCTSMRSPRIRASISASRSGLLPSAFCRSDPDAALRGFAKSRSPAAACRAFSASKFSTGKKISPRTSTRSGCPDPASRIGIVPMVRTFGVTSSPVTPSPRVAAEVSTPALVAQVDREAVDLQLAQPPDRRVGCALRGVALHPAGPLVELGRG